MFRAAGLKCRGIKPNNGNGVARGAVFVFSILTRLVFRDILIVTLFSLVAVTGLLMVLGAMFEGGKTGLDPVSILRLLPYIVAPSLPYTIPTCLLFACTYVFGTMSGTNEIVAVKAGGINAMRLIRPIIIFSIVVSLGCVWLSDQVIPWCQKQLRMTLLGDMETTLFTYLRQTSSISGPDLPYELYVSNIDGTRLLQPIIKHRDPKGGYDMVLRAREASLSVERSSNLTGHVEIVIRLIDGVLSTDPGNSAYFLDRTERMPIPELLKGDQFGISERGFKALDEQSEKFSNEELQAKFELATTMGMCSLRGEPAVAASVAGPAVYKIDFTNEMAYKSICEKHNRIARSMAAMPFVLLGCPLSILYRRREVLQTFFICFLPIITLYYPTLILSYNVLKESESQMFFLLWLPSLLMIIASIPFIRQLIRH